MGLKMLGLSAVAASAMMAFVGTSATSANTVLCHTLIMSGCAAAKFYRQPHRIDAGKAAVDLVVQRVALGRVNRDRHSWHKFGPTGSSSAST